MYTYQSNIVPCDTQWTAEMQEIFYKQWAKMNYSSEGGIAHLERNKEKKRIVKVEKKKEYKEWVMQRQRFEKKLSEKKHGRKGSSPTYIHYVQR